MSDKTYHEDDTTVVITSACLDQIPWSALDTLLDVATECQVDIKVYPAGTLGDDDDA